MPYVPPSGEVTALDIEEVFFFPIKSDGTINAPPYPVPATTPYEGLKFPMPKTLAPNLGAPRLIPVVAQGRVQTTFILPPIDAKSLEVHLAYMDLDIFAELSRVKVRTIAGSKVMAAGTNKQGLELPGLFIAQQLVAHGASDEDQAVGYIFPRVKASITWPAMNENPIDVTVTMSIGKTKNHFIGKALGETDDGATEASMFPIQSFNFKKIVAWVGDGSEDTFLLPADSPAADTFADTFKVYDLTANNGTPVAGDAFADSFVADSAPTDGHILMGFYDKAAST